MYPQLNSSDNVGVTELRMLTTAAQQADLTEVQEQQQPLNSNEDNSHSNGESVVQTRLYSNGSAAVDHSGGGGSASASRGPVPRRKVKFLHKLMNFCGDPKRREQTCNKRNRTFTLCKEIDCTGYQCIQPLIHQSIIREVYHPTHRLNKYLIKCRASTHLRCGRRDQYSGRSPCYQCR